LLVMISTVPFDIALSSTLQCALRSQPPHVMAEK
jgi:hypothetical protein